MSTAVDTAFEELVASDEDAGDPMHAVCIVCHPLGRVIPSGAIAICGYVSVEDGSYAANSSGVHKCAPCLASREWPCGHGPWR